MDMLSYFDEPSEDIRMHRRSPISNGHALLLKRESPVLPGEGRSPISNGHALLHDLYRENLNIAES